MSSTDRFCKREAPETYPKDEDWPTKKGLHVYKDKDIKELQKKLPDVKICTSPKCEFTNYDHKICYEYDQHNADMAKRGTIRTMYEIIDWKDDLKSNKIFEWYNGKKWVKLKQ